MVDGRRVNEIDLSGVDWTQIPLDQIQRVEIVRGTGTVLYGDNAVGGVINIITKPPAEKLTARVSPSFGSYGRIREEVSVTGGHRNVAGSLSASYNSTDGYRDNNEFRTKDVGGKIFFDLTEFLSLNLSGLYHRDDFGLPGAISENQLHIDRRSAKFPFDKGETTDQYFKLGADWDLGEYGRIVFDSSYRDRESEAQFLAFGTFVEERETDTWAITPRYVWNGEIFNHANTLIAGGDIYWSEQDVENFFAVAGPPIPSGSATAERDSYGFYFNNEFSLLENLILSVGVRHERVRYDLRQQDSAGSTTLEDTVTEHENAYSAGLTFLYSSKSSVFARAN